MQPAENHKKSTSSDNLLETQLVLAPIRGITDCHFRTIFHRYFPGFDLALAPFINPQRASNFQPNQIKDLLPEANPTLPVIPQLLHTDAQDFLFLANRLADFGYTEINWNLGCPAPMVTKKKRGSGLLPYPDKILAFLDQIMEKLPIKLSIKTRLGFESPDELLHLLPKLDQYPLTEIIIHGRLGKQLYKGTTDLENFTRCLHRTKHPIVYNGDIKTTEGYISLQTQFPGINKWMIGRGILADPFLAGEIKGIQQQEKIRLLQCFHADLFACYRELLSGEAHLLGRMKQLWVYLSVFFPPAQKTWKKIKKCTTEEKYLRVTKECFATIDTV